MGFARKVGSGVKSFFYEPYQGIDNVSIASFDCLPGYCSDIMCHGRDMTEYEGVRIRYDGFMMKILIPCEISSSLT
jgi:hypothetical protein